LILLGVIWLPVSGATCGYDPLVVEILSLADRERWVNWIAELSGAEPVPINNGEAFIQTRSSYVLFEPGDDLSAFTYIQNELVNLGFIPGRDFTIHTYAYPYGDRHPERNWKNLILTFPGADPYLQSEKVLLVAHLDSTSNQEQTLAPGADDNGTGASGLLEAAAILSQFRFDRTIHLVWFSGEEHSRLGSNHFVADYADWMPDIRAVINLDMFGFDWDGDRCFEVHAGTLPGSHEIGKCLASVIEAYDLDLTFDYLDDENAYTLSDHYPFWQQGVPAVMVIENYSFQPGGVCGVTDRNYHYHHTSDILSYINADTGFSILQAGIAALSHLSGPQEACFPTGPRIRVYQEDSKVTVTWENLGAKRYQLWQEQDGHWVKIGKTGGTVWVLPAAEGQSLNFKVIAFTEDGCQSPAGLYHSATSN
jgi:leucyl aminopeptidase